MNISIISSSNKAEKIIMQLLSPWHVCYSTPDRADVVISYKDWRNTGKTTVIIPSETTQFNKWFKDNNLVSINTKEKKLLVPATDDLNLTLRPQTNRVYVGNKLTEFVDDTISFIQREDSQVLLPVDLIKEYNLKINETLNPKISSIYRFVTGLPIPYTLSPARLRSFLFNVGNISHNNAYVDNLDLDALRYLLKASIEKASGKNLINKSWKGHKYACTITHDVDTDRGSSRAYALKKLEEQYDIASAWFIPTERYKLDSELLLNLVNHGEVGVHGTKHDGKLISLSKEKTVKRLSEAKRKLEAIIGNDVVGFRAPLLQHNNSIIDSLGKANYTYDTSIPTWEPKHPSTMKPRGIGTIYPLELNGILEIPVSIPQDYQMIKVLGMNPRQTVKNWDIIREIICKLGGLCTFLVHPDYEIADRENLLYYEELLNLVSDNQVLINTPREIVKVCD